MHTKGGTMATILIVDDHAINRQFLLTLLGYGGHTLLEAAEGARALQLVRSERPDLVITDILMPNMDGYEFVTRMRADSKVAQTPVIFYTASYRAREARSMAQACGVHWVLQKPSEPETILKTVQEALGSPSQPSTHLAPQLSASIEADQFSSINDQLLEYLGELGSTDDSMLEFGQPGGVLDATLDVDTTLEAQRNHLRVIARKMSTSLTSLQTVSLRLTRLVELGLDLAAERDPGRMLEILCRAAHGICGAQYAAVAMLEDDSRRLRYCFARGLSQEVQAALRQIAPQTGILGQLLGDRIPARLMNHTGQPQALGLPASHPPVHSFLGVPIVSKEQAYGWLYLANKTDNTNFSDVDEQVIATIASQLAAAYENLVLYEKVHRQRSQLQLEVTERKQAQEALRRNLRGRTVLARCNHVLVHAVDENDLLTEMCRTIVDTGGYPMVWIGYSQNDEERSLVPVAQNGMQGGKDSPYADDCCENGYGWHAAKVAIRTGMPFVVPDVHDGGITAQWKVPASPPDFRSVLSLPLKDGVDVFGALTLYEKEPNAFDVDQIEMLQELADDIAYGGVSLRMRRARDLAEQSLLATEEKLTGILNSIDNIVWSISDNEMLYISPVAESVYGLPLADFYRNKDLWFDVIHPEDQPAVRESMKTLLEQGAVTREYRILRPNGGIRWLEDRTKAVHDANGKLLRFDGVASDISDRKKYQGRIEYLATHDPLTGLANRNLLRDRLAQAIAFSRRSGQMLALLFVDLDRFKDINDSFGHAVGDKLLIEVSERLRRVVREGDTVARPGGDEFIVLLTDFSDPESVNAVAVKLLNEFAAPYVLTDVQLHVNASIGVSLYPNDGDDIETLLRNTDTAMYRAKERGGNGFQLYTPEMSVRAIERMELENALHRAVERGEFQLYYQPKVDLKSGQIVGAEALIRWFHPELGLVLPNRFIPLAEEIGLISSIGQWVLRTACAQNKAWQDAGLIPISVAVNLSARQFRHEELLGLVSNVLKETGMEPGFLELELTESIVMHSAEQFAVRLHELKMLGVKLAIDDFGTGYSSLSYLKRFSLDRLKIDQSFVNDIVTDADDAAITRSVISLGHSLNLRVVAEGVETAEQLAFLRSNGCDEVQGNFYSEPISAEDFSALLHERKRYNY
jgi:diguanylate cyclase (GGDEF)-like protein/PAS domain S-box-containing protein